MISDYYRSFTRRIVTRIPDEAGGFTEAYTDTTVYAYLTVLSGYEMNISHQLGIDATARLFTDATLTERDRIIDGTVEYEIVMPYDNHHRYYDLKRLH
jgi:hypothetical protein